MNKKKTGIAPAVVSIILLLVAGIALEVVYRYTFWVPMRLAASLCLFPAAINLVLLVCCAIANSAGKKAGPQTGEAAADPTEAESESLAAEALSPEEAAESPEGAALLAASEEEDKKEKKKKKGNPIGRFFRMIGRAIGSFFIGIGHTITKNGSIFLAVLLVAVTAVFQYYFYKYTRLMTTQAKSNYAVVLLFAGLFVVFIAAEKWCKYAKKDVNSWLAAILGNLRESFILARYAMIVNAVAMVLILLNFYNLQRAAMYTVMVIWYYQTFFMLLSIVIRVIKRELVTYPAVTIPLPFERSKNGDLGVITYLEENTGITMRSLWSLKMIKNISPYVVIVSLALLWIATGFITIEPYQQGAVYRFGKLLDEPLEPGLNLTLPWPIDKVDVYSTESLMKMTIGYQCDDNTDNTWTGEHGSSEYRLLLGDGNEVVAMNLRLVYKISDVISYLTTSTRPDKLLEAKAYEMIADRTINTTLNTLLSTDRSAFADNFKVGLDEYLKEQNIGLEMVSVVLESIHPPIDVSPVYQEMVSAEIEKVDTILKAESYAETTVIKANMQKETSIMEAEAESYTKISEAKASVAEFMACLEAYKSAPSAYEYYRQMKTTREYLSSVKLVIASPSVDTSQIFFTGINTEIEAAIE